MRWPYPIAVPHARLREELLNFTVEAGPSGPKVNDRGRVHQDHAVALRGVVASLGTLREDHVGRREPVGRADAERTHPHGTGVGLPTSLEAIANG